MSNKSAKAGGEPHDVVIVGGGSAGIATAVSLLKRRPDLDILGNYTLDSRTRSALNRFLFDSAGERSKWRAPPNHCLPHSLHPRRRRRTLAV